MKDCIVTGDLNGVIEALYVGNNADEAKSVFKNGVDKGELDNIRIYIRPNPTRRRAPAYHKALAERRKKDFEAAAKRKAESELKEAEQEANDAESALKAAKEKVASFKGKKTSTKKG